MSLKQTLLTCAMFFAAVSVHAGAPQVNSPLPTLDISDRGELVMNGEDFSFAPWSSDTSPGTIHVLQYFGGTMAASETFKPFTDQIESSAQPGSVHVTTIINLDAAMWGTSGFVVSELKKNKKIHPTATMVLDEDGIGVKRWELGKDGAGLVIVDSEGKVLFFSREPLSDIEIQTNLELIKANPAS